MGADNTESTNIENIKQSTDTMKISFISKGAGIDDVLKEKIQTIISDFNLTYDKNGWGREGEVDYLINLENLSTSKKKSFTSLIKDAIGNSDMAFLSFL